MRCAARTDLSNDVAPLRHVGDPRHFGDLKAFTGDFLGESTGTRSALTLAMIELTDRLDRDVSEDAAVGAYVARSTASACRRRAALRAASERWDSPRLCGRSPIRTESLTTISPTASEQLSALVNLDVVTNVISYIIALSALPMIMRLGRVEKARYRHNVAWRQWQCSTACSPSALG